MRILLVEDDKNIAGFIKKGLEEENYAVDLADNGEDALHYALTEPYDCIVLDVMLPKLSGFEVCSELRNEKIGTPILMLTARGSVKDKVTGLDSGADDYLTKPFSFDEFLARIRVLLRRKSSSLLELSIGPLRVDTQARRVYIEGKEVTLRAKEFAILEFLLRNKEKIVSRTQILENVWDYQFETNTNLVDVHIKSIRNKLKEFHPPELIHTVRGMGYMLKKNPD